jgi:hypothetical protein
MNWIEIMIIIIVCIILLSMMMGGNPNHGNNGGKKQKSKYGYTSVFMLLVTALIVGNVVNSNFM